MNTARLELARLSVILRRPDEAAQFAREALKVQPGHADATLVLARALMMKGDVAGARRAYERALAADPNHLEALTSLTALDIEAKNPAAVRARLDARIAASRTEDANLQILSPGGMQPAAISRARKPRSNRRFSSILNSKERPTHIACSSSSRADARSRLA